MKGVEYEIQVIGTFVLEIHSRVEGPISGGRRSRSSLSATGPPSPPTRTCFSKARGNSTTSSCDLNQLGRRS